MQPEEHSEGSEPIVSIIIPCYNAERTIGESIESALSQTYQNIEVVVIDDGSTDSSLSVIQSFGSRVRFESRLNQGACASRNYGLALAKGSLIQFLDADDILFPTKLEKMLPMTIQAGPSYLTVCNWFEQGFDRGERTVERRASYTSGDPFIWCLTNSLQTASPLHWRISLIAVNGFDELLPRCQEYDLHLRILSHGVKLQVLDQSLFLVRRQQGSLSSDYVKILWEHPGILMRLRAQLRNRNCLSMERDHYLAFALSRGACHLAQQSQWADARTLFLTAEAIVPGGKYLGLHRWESRYLARLLSPARTEWLIKRMRKIFSQLHSFIHSLYVIFSRQSSP